MNKKEIEELIKFVAKAGVSEVSLEMKDIKITIKNTAAARVEQVVRPHLRPQGIASTSREHGLKKGSLCGYSSSTE